MQRENNTWTVCLFGVGILAAYIIIPSLLPYAPSKSQKRYTTGLVNTGNDCFANSTFQALASLSILNNFLESVQDVSKPWTHAMANVLKELAREDSTPHQISVWPALRLFEQLYHVRLSRQQQDAHEMLLKILELLDQEQKGNETELPFKGILTDTIRCRRCGHKTNKDTEFLVLERLPGESFLQPQSELIEDFNCSECGPTVIEKTCRVSKVPRILAIHINRSMYSNASFRDSTAVDIPLNLGLLQELRLKAIVYHRGNHYRGHYTAARRKLQIDKDSSRQQWWVISDDSVKQGTTKQVLDRNKEAYMLFYETKPPATAPTTLESKTQQTEAKEI